MRIEFPYNLSQPDPEADAFIRDHILSGASLPEEQLAAWYRHMQQSLPFPFKAFMLVDQTPTSKSYRQVIIKRMAEVSRCGPLQLWVHGKLASYEDVYFYFFLADMSSVDKIEAYKPVYHWKYWLQKQQII